MDPVFGGASLGLSGHVEVVALQPDGKALVGGSFAGGIVRLNADGTLDTTFSADIGNDVEALAVQPDGKILVDGDMLQVDGVPKYNLFRLNPDGTPDPTFNADGTQYSQFAEYTGGFVLQPDGKVLIRSPGNLSRLNTDGTLDTGFNASIGTVGDFVLQPDGKVLIGGFVSNYQYEVARLNADGTPDASFAAVNSADPINALALQPDGKLLVVGTFSGRIVRLNVDGTVDTSFNTIINLSPEVLALQSDGKILVAGYDYSLNGVPLYKIVRLNADGSQDASFEVDAAGAVNALVLQPDGKLLAGGYFTEINGVGTASIVRLTTVGQVDDYFAADSASGPNNRVRCLALQPDGRFLIGGDFSQVDGTTHNSVARLRADGTPDATFRASATNGGASAQVDAIAVQPDGRILIGGAFSQVNNVNEIGVARLNPDGTLDTSFNARGNGAGTALVLQLDGKVLVAGAFADQVARLNADGSFDSSFQVSTYSFNSDQVYFGGLALQPDGKVLVGGDFNRVNNSIAAPGIVRLNQDGTLDTGFSAKTDGYVFAFAIQPDGRIVIGGEFANVNDALHLNIARLNADGTSDASFTAETDSDVNTLILQPDSQMVVGGYFTEASGVNASNIARLNADGTYDSFFNAGGVGASDTVNALALQPDGKILVGGDFTALNSVVRNYVARLNGGGSPDFFNGGVSVGGGFYYLQFPDGAPFGYYNLYGEGYGFPYFFHADLGLEYFFDANDGNSGVYLYDFASSDFFYTSPTFPFPYLYDFGLHTVLYYYPDPSNPGHYNTNGVRYFYEFSTGKIITK